jgi:hypothetical protein
MAITATSGVNDQYFHMNGANVFLRDATTPSGATDTFECPFRTVLFVGISSSNGTGNTPAFYWSASLATITLYTAAAVRCKIMVIGY